MPVALPANVAEFYLIATRMVAAIADVRGYDVTDPQIRTAVPAHPRRRRCQWWSEGGSDSGCRSAGGTLTALRPAPAWPRPHGAQQGDRLRLVRRPVARCWAASVRRCRRRQCHRRRGRRLSAEPDRRQATREFRAAPTEPRRVGGISDRSVVEVTDGSFGPSQARSARSIEDMAAARGASSARWGMIRALGLALRAATRPGAPGMGERLSALPRMVRAAMRGEYAGVTRGRLLGMLGALLYVVSPVDLVPESLFTIFAWPMTPSWSPGWLRRSSTTRRRSSLGRGLSRAGAPRDRWPARCPAGERTTGNSSAHWTVRSHVVR
jgi:hypothetical protein